MICNILYLYMQWEIKTINVYIYIYLRGNLRVKAFLLLLNVSHITSTEHNSSHSNILYRKILNIDRNM